MISQLSLVLKADLTVSAGLHFRYGVSYNEFSVTWDPETFRNKLEASRKQFGDVWDAVKTQVEGVVECVSFFFFPRFSFASRLTLGRDDVFPSDNQKALLANALAVANRVPGQAPVQGGPAAEETAWKNCWNWFVRLFLSNSSLEPLCSSRREREGLWSLTTLFRETPPGTYPTRRLEVWYSISGRAESGPR